ncbi:hypothetical protein [Saliterribacillus persicus]|uniref:Coat F domain-containing protein n=1 Tax=Saliterribacillus persicus TaxID=930114 RepID=A0A368XG63_9BACI|nr:hypothetical protein [Saliterribacillus persicus]RCW66982.1 hypothetical protein DFR57_10878 [Saliterribacillus persicus]
MQHHPNTESQKMNQPPEMVSNKDHLYLTDMLSWTLLAAKKAHFYTQQCSNKDVKQALTKAQEMHQHHYEKILHHLNRN